MHILIMTFQKKVYFKKTFRLQVATLTTMIREFKTFEFESPNLPALNLV